MMRIHTVSGVLVNSIENESILQAALTSGIIFEYSCGTGLCGVCKTTLLEGSVEELKEQIALTIEEREQKKILTCCCSPVSDVLIDAEDLSVLHGIEVKTLPARIKSLRLLSPDIVEVTLRLPPTANFKFIEGQYLDIIGPDSVRRSYSIASNRLLPEIVLLIKRVKDGVLSEYWFNQAKENDLLRIEGPKGTFFIREKNTDLVFLGTGTGIAPIISILTQLDADESFVQTHNISLFWGNRKKEDFVWMPVFSKLKVSVVNILSGDDNTWGGARGYTQDVALSEIDDLSDVHVYACGSNKMILSAKRAFYEKGLREKDFYSDAFVQS